MLFLCAMTLPTMARAVGEIRPKLVVGIAVDQMRWDYLYRFYDEYVDGGFRRMLRDGYSFENCQINYIPSVTAIGHTSLYTGSVPASMVLPATISLKTARWSIAAEIPPCRQLAPIPRLVRCRLSTFR